MWDEDTAPHQTDWRPVEGNLIARKDSNAVVYVIIEIRC